MSGNLSRVIPLILLLLTSSTAEGFLHYPIIVSFDNKSATAMGHLPPNQNSSSSSFFSESSSKPHEIAMEEKGGQGRGKEEENEIEEEEMNRNLVMMEPRERRNGRTGRVSEYVGFPYKFEGVPAVPEMSNKMGEVHQGLSHNMASEPDAEERIDKDDIKHMMQSFDLQPIQNIFPAFGSSHERPPHRRPPMKLTNNELNFIGILAAIAVKLVISTALASWFLVAGQILYAIASMTGTTAVFGMDSTIGYIYKTLPLVEALLRGETMFSHHH